MLKNRHRMIEALECREVLVNPTRSAEWSSCNWRNSKWACIPADRRWLPV